MKKINIFLPFNYSFLIIKKKNNHYIYIYNKHLYYSLFLKKNYFFFEKLSNSIIIKQVNNKYNLIKNKNIEIFLKNILIYYKIKIKFKGKGLKIIKLKKKKIFKLFFGKSHKTLLIYNKIILKKIKKYKFILLSTNLNLLNKTSKNILKIKPLNLYTKRGLRISKSIYYKRISKKTSFK